MNLKLVSSIRGLHLYDLVGCQSSRTHPLVMGGFTTPNDMYVTVHTVTCHMTHFYKVVFTRGLEVGEL